jgi:hypothetical protein
MKFMHKLFVLLFLFIGIAATAQEIQRKKVHAFRIDQPLKVDGILDESFYNEAEMATDFVQLQPYNGQPSYQKTEVKIFYDNDALYIGAMLYDNPDSLANYITTRDDLGVSDYFDVFIDPNNEGLIAYEFAVTPANSQSDIKAIKDGGYDNEDGSWNAVWQSATKIQHNGWSVEFRIPYSALRFPAKEDAVWGLNFFRRIRRYNSNNSWNLVNNKISGFIQQSGELLGLKNIKPPVRLSITPYIAEYLERKPDATQNEYVFKGGLDLKYGLSESHTLDMMLIPDFGQIQSDDEELNLSPYELHYDEKRQFFNEGGDLFGRAGIFYSRRIGSRPIFSQKAHDELGDDEKITYNPTSTQLVNATKISGRDKNGWGIGVLNAMSLPAKAEIENTKTGAKREVVTQPFTNYNVSIVEKTMANNSLFSLINTNMSMVNNPYQANVTATQFQLKNKKQTYQLTGVGGLSYKSQAEKKTGYGYNLELRKMKGATRFDLSRSVFSNTLDFNDLGYLQRNNVIEHRAEISYNIFEPFSIFKTWSTQWWFENTQLFEPNVNTENIYNGWVDATFRNNWWLGVFAGYSFGDKDYFEPRSSNNRYYDGPAYFASEFNFRTDQNKKLSWSLNYGFYDTEIKERWGDWMTTNLWWKATQRFNVFYEIAMRREVNATGYVDHLSNDSIFFGTYDRNTFENTLSMAYNFNTKTAIDFRARHYWSVADYEKQLFFLNNDGSLSTTDYTKDTDVNYNAFNIDMSFRWEFAPGSELSVAWKNAIFNSNKLVDQKFIENIKETLASAQNNSVSVKVLYYIDYNTLKKKRS